MRHGQAADFRQEEDRRRICRERRTVLAERIEHVNRIKGLLFAQGVFDYEPLHRNCRARLDALKTGDGCVLPDHLKAQIGRELDRPRACRHPIEGSRGRAGRLARADARNRHCPGAGSGKSEGNWGRARGGHLVLKDSFAASPIDATWRLTLA